MQRAISERSTVGQMVPSELYRALNYHRRCLDIIESHDGSDQELDQKLAELHERHLASCG